jgi:hypothetical protein
MEKQNGRKSNYFGTALTIVLLFFILIFSDNNFIHKARSYQYSFIAESVLRQNNAVPIDEIQLPTILNSCLVIFHNNHLILFNKTFKLFADNSRINLEFILLERTELLIKPLLTMNFRVHFSPPEQKEIPILS